MAKLRKLHIKEELWKYYFKGQRGNLIIFSPYGQRLEITIEEFLKWRGDIDADYQVEHILYKIPPSDIKKYIEGMDKIFVPMVNKKFPNCFPGHV